MIFLQNVPRERNIESRSKGICQAPLDLLQQSRRPLQGVESKTVLSHSGEGRRTDYVLKFYRCKSLIFMSLPSFSFFFSIHLVWIFRVKKRKKKNSRNSARCACFQKKRKQTSSKKKNEEKISRENIIFFFALDETGICFKVSWQKWGQKFVARKRIIGLSSRERGDGKNLSQ